MNGSLPEDCITRVQQVVFIRKINRYQVMGTERILYFEHLGVLKRCITEVEVAPIFLEAHDHGGHYALSIIIRKLSKYYWPLMAKDVRDYVSGCLVCAKHGTAVRSQLLSRLMISTPMEFLGIDFVGPFPKFESIKTFYILVVVDYFSRFMWSKAIVTDNSDSVISFLENIFVEHGIPVDIYADSGAHFGKATQKFAELHGIVWYTSPVSAKKSYRQGRKGS